MLVKWQDPFGQAKEASSPFGPKKPSVAIAYVDEDQGGPLL